MPSTATITAFYEFQANTKARASRVNYNFSNFRGHNLPINTDTATASDITHDLGASDHRWRTAYLQDISLRTSTTTAGLVIRGLTSNTGGAFELNVGASVASLILASDSITFKIGSTTKFFCDSNGISILSHKQPNRVISSNGSGSFSSNSTAYTDITNLTVDISLTGSRPVMIALMADPGVVQECGLMVESGTGTAQGVAKSVVKIVRGVTDISYNSLRATVVGDSGGNMRSLVQVPPGVIFFIDNSAPSGTQTYKLQVSVDTSTTNFYASFCRVFAWEMPA